ncbi:MAG: segregation and condensation protein A [Chitinophagales bacterium]
MNYQIKLPQFEGPFDLLLFFIERDELDIYDIPIAELTRDFLDYMHQMEQLNIELASEFILVAATLMRIKAKMLIPRKELNEEGNEVDPREELVKRLLEYKKYKIVVEELRVLEKARAERFERGNTEYEAKQIYQQYSNENDLESINLYKLMSVFHVVLERFEERKKEVKHEVVRYPYTIRNQKEALVKLINTPKELNFQQLFIACENRVHAIFRLLAMLEMAQEKRLYLRVGLGMNNFWVRKNVVEH